MSKYSEQIEIFLLEIENVEKVKCNIAFTKICEIVPKKKKTALICYILYPFMCLRISVTVCTNIAKARIAMLLYYVFRELLD